MQSLKWIVIFHTNYVILKIECQSWYLYLEPSFPSVFETQDNGTTILIRIAMRPMPKVKLYWNLGCVVSKTNPLNMISVIQNMLRVVPNFRRKIASTSFEFFCEKMRMCASHWFTPPHGMLKRGEVIASRRRTTRVVCAKDISPFNYGTHLINESHVSKFDDAVVFQCHGP